MTSLTGSENEIGRGGTFIALADLIFKGVRAFTTDEGFAYDIVADIDGKMLKIQVKTTREKSRLHGKSITPFYHFSLSQGKEKNKRAYKNIDGFALVMADTKQVAYIPLKDAPSMSISLADRNDERKGRCNSNASRRRYFQDMTWEKFYQSFN